MSRRKYEYGRCKCERHNYKEFSQKKDNCCCNFNWLVILILILLQFGKKEKDSHQLVDNSILFIITLFFLSCCTRCE